MDAAHSPVLPQLLCDIDKTIAADRDAQGALWRITALPRQLDSNVIRLGPGAVVDAHDGPDIDVLMLVLDGTGHLLSGETKVPMWQHRLFWLPRLSRREIRAGEDGLVYLTVHHKREALQVSLPSSV
ncbi:MAG: hypothetical protein WAS07_04125 [Micropruina sp.]